MTNNEADDLRTTFGANVRRARERSGWTQGELADRLSGHSMTRDKILRLESGTRPTPLDEAVAIAQALEMRLDDLLMAPRDSSLQGQIREQVQRLMDSRQKASEHVGSVLINRAELARLLEGVSEDALIALQDTWSSASDAYDSANLWWVAYAGVMKYLRITQGLAEDEVHEWVKKHGGMEAVMESVTGMRPVDDDG